MTAQIDQFVRAGLSALIANNAGLGTSFRFNLKSKHPPKPRCYRAPLFWILKSESGLGRVPESYPKSLKKIYKENSSE